MEYMNGDSTNYQIYFFDELQQLVVAMVKNKNLLKHQTICGIGQWYFWNILASEQKYLLEKQ